MLIFLLLSLGLYLTGGVLLSAICILSCGVDADQAIKHNDPLGVLKAREDLRHDIRVTWTWPWLGAVSLARGAVQGFRLLRKKP